MNNFGSAVTREYGANMLVLSSGTARTPGQPDYSDPGGSDKGYTTTNPAGFPVNSPACPGVISGQLHDSIALKLKLRAPTNAKSLSFKFKFYTYEFPQFICDQYNDIFVAILRNSQGQFIAGADPTTGNISFDKDGNYLSVNAGFLNVCAPQQAGGKQFDCPASTGELAGTGFEGHAGTTWLQTKAPVEPGQQIIIRWAVYDSGDGILDSSTFVDNW